MKTDILIVGGGTGGVAAALAACAMGRRVILTEETDWIGGQLTAQAVPPDENPWIEQAGCTRRYRAFRDGVRAHYREHYALTDAAKKDSHLNPGGGYVSRLCFEPKVGFHVLDRMLATFIASGQLVVLTERKPLGAEVNADRVASITFDDQTTIEAEYVLDATELGDLLPLANVEYVTGAESRRETGEPHAVDGPAQPGNVQALTWCVAMAYDPRPGADYRFDKPAQYNFWRSYQPKLTPPYAGGLLDWTIPVPSTLSSKRCELFRTRDDTIPLFPYRQIVSHDRLMGRRVHDVTIVNWPQNDYFLTNIIDQPRDVVARALEQARQLSLSLLYWLQTEQGYPMLYLPGWIAEEDGFAAYPYIRESRRIRAIFTVTENHVGTQARYGDNPLGNPMDFSRLGEPFFDSVGIGYYRIDLHPSTSGANFIDVASLPFQIPLGALIPIRMTNLLPACKNIGSTHITNGCYRLHPVEWNIGEAAGLLAAYCLDRKVPPAAVRASEDLLKAFQELLIAQGIPLKWRA